MERDFPETVEAKPELLGYHFSLAGLPAKAVEYWQRAAQFAAKRSAMVEALGHLRQALEQLKV
jgi:predicted ATPase